MVGLSALVAGSSLLGTGCASLDYAHRTRPVDNPKTPYEKFCNNRIKERLARKELNKSKSRPITNFLILLLYGYGAKECSDSGSSSGSSSEGNNNGTITGGNRGTIGGGGNR